MGNNIGIDLGKENIKIALLDDKRINIKIKDSEVYNIEYHDTKEYFKLVEKHIKTFLKRNKIKLAKLHFSISPDAPFIIYNFLQVPDLKKRELAKALKYEMQAQLEENINNYTIKWEVLEEDTIKNILDVFVVGIENNLIEYIAGLSKFTWSIGSIELQALEFAKLFNKPTGILDIGKNKIRCYLYNKKKIVDIIVDSYESKDDIWEKGRDLIRELETKHLMPIEKIYIPGYYGSKVDYITDFEKMIHIPAYSLDVTIYDKVDEINNADMLIDDDDDEKYEDFGYILFNEEDIEEVKEDINEEVDEVDNNNLSTNKIKEDEKNKDSDYAAHPELVFAINAIVNQEKNINLATKTINFNFNNVLLTAAMAVLIINISVNMVANKYDNLIEQVSNSNINLMNGIDQLEIEKRNLESQKEEYNEIIKKVDAIEKQDVWLSDILYTIEKNTPKDAAISNIEIKEGEAKIKGYTKNYRDIAYFAMALEKYGDLKIDTIINSSIDANVNSRQLERGFTVSLKHDGVVVNKETKQ